MEYFSSFEICILAETFIEEKQIERVNAKLPSTHNWIWSVATRAKKKGRAMGGILMGIRKDIRQGREWIIPEHHIIAKEIEINKEMHIIIGVYNRSGISKIKQELSDLVEINPRRNIVIGDWNARIGTLGDRNDGSEKRNTRDQVINEEGIKWNEFMETHGLELLNGNTEGDWNGEYTHDGYQGSSVIDYACATPTVTDEIELFTVESRTESDHQPIVIRWGQVTEEGGHHHKHNHRRVQDWNQESITLYNQRLESSLREYENPTWSNVQKCIHHETRC